MNQWRRWQLKGSHCSNKENRPNEKEDRVSKRMKVKFIAKENIGNKCENKPVTNQQTSNGNQMQSANVASKT